MDIGAIAELAVQFGPSGLIVGFFAWRDLNRDKRIEARETRLEQILSDNAEADKQTAVALTLLAERLR